MDHLKFYLQPLGFLRGCSPSTDEFPTIAGGKLKFSLLKIISRTNGGISSEIVSSANFEEYLNKRTTSEADELRGIMENIVRNRSEIKLPDGHSLTWEKPILQGILNVTPDSFSDGGVFDDSSFAVTHALEMSNAGAGIIDVGGETTKPGAKPVPIEIEKKRVIPVIKELSQKILCISIDSRNADVMDAAVKAGAHIINDVSALEHDPKSIEVVKESGAPVILMHAQGNPDVMQKDPKYECAILDIYDYLKSRIDYCVKNGIDKDKIIVDPGIGFGKTVEHNLEILANISIFHGLGVPILIGVSRKSFIGKITNEEVANKRITGSIAAAQVCFEQGIQIARVHDVDETENAILVYNAISDKIAQI